MLLQMIRWAYVHGYCETSEGYELILKLITISHSQFQKILTLSRGTSWRLDGIQAAASYSGLDIKHPPQPPIAQELLAAFQTLGDEPPGEGSARAWMAHLNLLRFVFQSEFDTALIVEDDVDWDVSIREQMKKLSDGVRALLTARHEASLAGRANHNSPRGVLRQFKKSDEYGADSSQTKPAGSPAPYGRDWDVLWIGNCGENVSPAVESHDPVLIQTWPDKSAIPHEKYTGFAHNAIMNLPQGTRAAIRSEGPICTFAYGVTNSGARKVLELAGSGDGRAYDIKLSKLCETGDLNCISVAPELFHEYKPAPGKDGALSSEIDAGNGQGEVAHDEALATEMGSTENIVHSARCRALFQTTCLGPGEETSEGS